MTFAIAIFASKSKKRATDKATALNQQEINRHKYGKIHILAC
jgi:hypothetical protein